MCRGVGDRADPLADDYVGAAGSCSGNGEGAGQVGYAVRAGVDLCTR
jgi:hypothetical protein